MLVSGTDITMGTGLQPLRCTQLANSVGMATNCSPVPPVYGTVPSVVPWISSTGTGRPAAHVPSRLAVMLPVIDTMAATRSPIWQASS